ncbi:MAG: DUF485 domain-containing protein [Fuerstiella sp.]|nr:DUF485 domain-containing protein [Fuerstiella sp.]
MTVLAIRERLSYAAWLDNHHLRNPLMETRSNPLGLTLFCVYLVIYTGFVLINAAAPQFMDWTPLAGLNLAILYGFTLIIIAFVLSIVYGFLAGQRDKQTNSENQGGAV